MNAWGNCRILFTLASTVAASTTIGRGEEFVSERYGFRFRIPDGFHERADSTPMTLRMFVEDEQSAEGYLITIEIQRLGQIVDPAQRLDPTQLPEKDGLRLTPELRRWQDLELQAIRQDAFLGPDEFVG